jgi:hypothetical protein
MRGTNQPPKAILALQGGEEVSERKASVYPGSIYKKRSPQLDICNYL